ncbi:MAG: hypothetical protein EBX38_02420 [Actinobacteria bacterium]|nr:hypothetical protein [Actinomycetota bacterium]
MADQRCDRAGARPESNRRQSSYPTETLRKQYALSDHFVALRAELDPERRFLNSYVERVLGA